MIAAMDPADLQLRRATYRTVVELGHAPTAQEVATVTGATPDEVRDGWQRLGARRVGRRHSVTSSG